MQYKTKRCVTIGVRENRGLSKTRDIFIDYILKPVALGCCVFFSNFFARESANMPVSLRTKLLYESAQEVSKRHKDGEICSYFNRTLFWCLSRGFEYDIAYYIRFHETIVLFNEKLHKYGLSHTRVTKT